MTLRHIRTCPASDGRSCRSKRVSFAHLARHRRCGTTFTETLLAIAGDKEVRQKLLTGYKVGDMTYKVHLDGYDLGPYLTGQAEKGPRESFIYCSDDQQVTGLRFDNWKLVFMEQRLRKTMGIWAEPFVTLVEEGDRR